MSYLALVAHLTYPSPGTTIRDLQSARHMGATWNGDEASLYPLIYILNIFFKYHWDICDYLGPCQMY